MCAVQGFQMIVNIQLINGCLLGMFLNEQTLNGTVYDLKVQIVSDPVYRTMMLPLQTRQMDAFNTKALSIIFHNQWLNNNQKIKDLNIEMYDTFATGYKKNISLEDHQEHDHHYPSI